MRLRFCFPALFACLFWLGPVFSAPDPMPAPAGLQVGRQRILVAAIGPETIILTRLEGELDWIEPEFRGQDPSTGHTWFQPVPAHRTAGTSLWGLFLRYGKPPIRLPVALGQALPDPFAGVPDVPGGVILHATPAGLLTVLDDFQREVVAGLPVYGRGEAVAVSLRHPTRWIFRSPEGAILALADLPATSELYHLLDPAGLRQHPAAPVEVTVTGIPAGYLLQGQAPARGSLSLGSWPPGASRDLTVAAPGGREFQVPFQVPLSARDRLSLPFASLVPAGEHQFQLLPTLDGLPLPAAALPELFARCRLSLDAGFDTSLSPEGFLRFQAAPDTASLRLDFSHDLFSASRDIRRPDGQPWPPQVPLPLQRRRVVAGTLIPRSYLDQDLRLLDRPVYPASLFTKARPALSLAITVLPDGAVLPDSPPAVLAPRERDQVLALARRHRFSPPLFGGVPVRTRLELVLSSPRLP